MTDLTTIFPVVPLQGIAGFWGLVLAAVLGVAFGFFLERAGFGSAKNLTSIFILRDFRVFRVMFSAVITGMLGAQLLSGLGLLNLGLVQYDPTFFWSMLTGGLVFGVGFYVGGFCPGTAAVALARGRWDGLVFLLGIVLGIYGFALLFEAVGSEPWFVEFYSPADAARQTLAGEGASWPWVLGLTAVALIGFKVVPLLERRFALATVEQLEERRKGGKAPEATPPVIGGVWVKIGAPLAGLAALSAAGLELGTEHPELRREAPRPAMVAVDEAEAETVAPRELASWLVTEAHRRAEDAPPNARVIDLRPSQERQRHPLPLATPVAFTGDDGRARLAAVLEELERIVPPRERRKPLVLVDSDGSDQVAEVTRALRRRGFDAAQLEGGYRAFREQIHAGEAPLFALGFRAPSSVTDEAPELAEIDQRLRRWLSGEASEDELPPRLSLPGAPLLPSKAVTVQATGGGGGGCG